jgi:transposase
MKKRQIYSGEFKVKVVLDLLHGDKSLTQLAEEYQLHPNQIKNWKSIFIGKAIEIMEDKRIKRKFGDELKCN